MRPRSRAHWFNNLTHAPAARVVCALEAVRQFEWLRITRTEDKRPALRINAGPVSVERYVEITFGTPGEDIQTALRRLNRQLSPVIHRRLQAHSTFRECVLLECARALLGDDPDLARGLLRRMIDATLGFEALGDLLEKNPKSLVRMLSRLGNPSARNLLAVFTQVCQANGARFTVQLAIKYPRATERQTSSLDPDRPGGLSRVPAQNDAGTAGRPR